MIDVRKKVAEITPEITQIREYIHENPELSMQEYNTCALLEDYVKKNVKYDRLKRVGETGLFFELKGTKPGNGPTIVFRGDIDALPIQEAENMSPRSKVPGVMHACGHDVHGTINVGAAKILSEMKDQFSGSIYFFIQPAEEILKGAKLFLNDPEIDFDQIDAVAALHISAVVTALFWPAPTRFASASTARAATARIATPCAIPLSQPRPWSARCKRWSPAKPIRQTRS